MNKFLSDNITQSIVLAADTVKRAFLATIETAKAAGKTAMVVVDEFGHDLELVFDGGVTNFSMKDFSCTIEQVGSKSTMTINTTTDDSSKKRMSENAEKREDIINNNRGVIRYNANAYIDKWADEMRNIFIDAAIFDTQGIANQRFQTAEKRGRLIGQLMDNVQTRQQQKKTQENFLKTIYRLFYKLEKHSVDIGKSNYLSDVIDRYVVIQPEAQLRQYVQYVSNLYDEHIMTPIEKPKNHDSLVDKILSSESMLGVGILTLPSPTYVMLPIIGYSVAKTIKRK